MSAAISGDKVTETIDIEAAYSYSSESYSSTPLRPLEGAGAAATGAGAAVDPAAGSVQGSGSVRARSGTRTFANERELEHRGSVSNVSSSSSLDNPSQAPPMVSIGTSIAGPPETVPNMVRGSSQRSITLVQPLKTWLALTGFSPSKSPLARAYGGLVWLLCVAQCVIMFSLTVYDLKLTESTMSGLAIVSLAPVVVFPLFVKYMRSGVLEDEVATCKYIDLTSGRTVRQLVVGHAFVAILFPLALYAAYNVILGLAIEDAGGMSKLLFYIQLGTSLWAFAAGTVPLVMFSLVCSLHRTQCRSFVSRITDATESLFIPSALKLHQAIHSSIYTSSKRFTAWVFPFLLVLSVSFTYQSYGYFRTQRDDDQFNGIYYLVVVGILLVSPVLLATSVTQTTDDIVFSVAEMYTTSFHDRAHITRFLTYLSNTDVSFHIFNVPMLPAYTSLILIGLTAIIGGFIRQATI